MQTKVRLSTWDRHSIYMEVRVISSPLYIRNSAALNTSAQWICQQCHSHMVWAKTLMLYLHSLMGSLSRMTYVYPVCDLYVAQWPSTFTSGSKNYNIISMFHEVLATVNVFVLMFIWGDHRSRGWYNNPQPAPRPVFHSSPMSNSVSAKCLYLWVMRSYCHGNSNCNNRYQCHCLQWDCWQSLLSAADYRNDFQ